MLSKSDWAKGLHACYSLRRLYQIIHSKNANDKKKYKKTCSAQ